MSADPFKQKEASPAVRADALYVHVPFCASKCRYCGFYSRALQSAESAEATVLATLEELRQRQTQLQPTLQTIYIGGGTPTALGPELLGHLLQSLRPLLGESGQFSCEANPAGLDAPMARTLSAGGVDRVTIGAQSFSDAELTWLGRIHKPQQIAAAVTTCRSAGIDNIGLDLIYGLPGQELATWSRTLEKAIALQPAHISCYALSFDEPSLLWQQLQAGQIHPAEDEDQERMYLLARDQLQAAGYRQYELSNFARDGLVSRHNLVYWQNRAYVGIGPAAASYIGGVRSKNIEDMARYRESISACRPATAESERLEARAAMAESLMLGLRLVEGVDRADFAARWGFDPVDAFAYSFSKHQAQGSVHVEPGRVFLDRGAYFIADAVFADILGEV
ncbi:MAG: radical SAM family heme chaperone HemW [Planctomycetota bacterium]